MRTELARLGAPIAAVALQALPIVSHAAVEPFTFGVAQTVSAQTNVYRVPDTETASRDLISSTALSAGLDQPFGRWRLTGSAALRLNRYKNNRALDNDGQGLQLRLEGTTFGEVATSLDYARNTNLVDFGASTDASLRVPARETSQHPPLRSEDDRMAMVEAVAEGLIDVIASFHTPADEESKRLPFEEAASGAVGLQTLLPAALRLVHGGHMSLAQLFRALALNPAKRLGLPQGRLAVGAPADLVLFDPNAPFVLDRFTLLSKAKNTPFDGAKLEGKVLATWVAGAQVYKAG